MHCFYIIRFAGICISVNYACNNNGYTLVLCIVTNFVHTFIWIFVIWHIQFWLHNMYITMYKITCSQHLAIRRMLHHISLCSTYSVITSSILWLLEFSLCSRAFSLSYMSKAEASQLHIITLSLYIYNNHVYNET